MLVLGRKEGEGIVIDDKIRVRVVSIDKGRIRLGIDAPRRLEVHREEYYQRIKSNRVK